MKYTCIHNGEPFAVQRNYQLNIDINISSGLHFLLLRHKGRQTLTLLH